MVNKNKLKEFSDSMKMFREQCLRDGMSEEEFRKLYFDSLKSLENRAETSHWQQIFATRFKVFIIIILIVACSVYNYKTIYSCIMCHLQDYIYPGLRLLRKISIPLLSLFPALSDLYHETCLIQNPFFAVTDMDCWPCSSVNNVREVHNPIPASQQQNAPFIYETEQNAIDFQILSEIYKNNQDLFNRESMKVLVNNKNYVSLHDVFTQNTIRENSLLIWKINNVQVAKLLRQIIPRPVIVPKFGQSTERFIVIDSSKDPYKIPDTECSYSFLLSLSGTRTINLVPAEECKHQCKNLKVELKETYLLWYNWWYWRPIVQPSTSNMTFLAHVGSYC